MLKTLILASAAVVLVATPADARHRHHRHYYYGYGSTWPLGYVGYSPYGYAVPMYGYRNYGYWPRYRTYEYRPRYRDYDYREYRYRHHWRHRGDWDDQGEDHDD